MGRGAATAALIEGDNAIDCWVIEAAGTCIAGTARAPVHKQDGDAVDIPSLIDIQLMLIGDFKLVALIGLEFGIEYLYGDNQKLTR